MWKSDWYYVHERGYWLCYYTNENFEMEWVIKFELEKSHNWCTKYNSLIGRIKISLKFVCLTKIENIAKSKDIIKM